MAMSKIERSPEQLAKIYFYSRFTTSHMEQMRILRGGGLLYPQRGKSGQLIRRSTDSEIQKREGVDVWRNVTEHAVVQAVGCRVLGELLGLLEDRLRILEIAGLLHDYDKPFQSTGLRRLNQRVAVGEISEEDGGRLKYDFFEESEKHSAARLKELGVTEEVVRIASADGHPALPRMMDPNVTIEERILHYIGSIVNESSLGLLDERMDALEKNEKYVMMNEYGKRVTWTGGRTLYEVQRDIGHQLEGEFVRTILLRGEVSEDIKISLRQNPARLPSIIREVLQSKYGPDKFNQSETE